MPLYEYQCQRCHRRVEKIQKFSDAPLTTCPHCNGTLERTLTAPAVQFKGSGWYKDLYSSARPSAAPTEGAAASAPAGDAGQSSGGDAKTASSPAPAATPASTPATPAASTAKD